MSFNKNFNTNSNINHVNIGINININIYPDYVILNNAYTEFIPSFIHPW